MGNTGNWDRMHMYCCVYCSCGVPSVCWVCSEHPQPGRLALGHSFYLQVQHSGCEVPEGGNVERQTGWFIVLYWSKYTVETDSVVKVHTGKLGAIHGTPSLAHSTQIPNQPHPAPPLTHLPHQQQGSQCCRPLLLPPLLAPHSRPPSPALLQLHLPPLQVMVVD